MPETQVCKGFDEENGRWLVQLEDGNPACTWVYGLG